MSAIFSKQFDTKLRLAAVAILLALGATGAVVGYLVHPKQLETGYTPAQPVPYSHKLHAGNLGMDCLYCHYTVDKSNYAAVPMTETCMNCHVRVKEKSPEAADGSRQLRYRSAGALGESAPAPRLRLF